MKFRRKFNIFFIFLLAVLYLFLPAGNLLNAATPEFSAADAAVVTFVFSSDNSPCDDCPCHQEQKETGCCDTGSYGCSCHTTPPSSISSSYAPTIILTGFFEPVRKTLDVYLQIFVPPQNYS